MKTLNDFYSLFPNRPATPVVHRGLALAVVPAEPVPAPVLARPDRYRERGFGAGYGRSSGYADQRSYAVANEPRYARVG